MKRQRLMKLLSLVLSICLLVSTVFTGTVISAEGANDTYDVWDGSSVSNNLEGEGTYTIPFLISSAADLLYLANNASATNTFAGKYFLLKCNIDLADNTFPMISKFSGIFDGNGYEIKGINISSTSSDIGFFKILDGTVRNLTLDGNITSTAPNVGGFAGSISTSGVTLVNCINKVDVKGLSEVAGFIGNASPSSAASVKIFACINDGNVTATSTSNENDAGGFIGYASGNVSEWNIAFSQNNGNITTKMYRSGGLVGRSNAPKFVIKYCVNNGTVKGFSTVGGLLSYNASNGTGTITNSVNLGKITSTQTSGSASLGAIVGYYAGSVTNVTVTNSYYCQSDVDFTTVTNGQSGTPKGTAVEKTALTDGTVVNNLGVFYVQGTNGPALRQYSDGRGSIDNPYVLKTKEELIMLSQMINVEQLWDYPDASFTLGNDINLEGDARFVGIGNGSKSFKGDFDGKGYTVSGLDLKHAHTGGLGFFGQIGGTNPRKISNLNVEGNVESTATANTPTIVGGLVGKNSTKLTIENCSFNGTVKSTYYKNSSGSADNNQTAASGLVCLVQGNLDINHCSVSGTIDGYGRGGSFVGAVNGNYVVNITNSYSVADVTGKGLYTEDKPTAGGLIGFLATGTINLSNCFYDGKAPDARTNGMAGPIINHKASGTFNCENTYFNSTKNTVAEASGYAYGVGKTTAQFKNGSIVKLLNETAGEKIFKQGKTHPEFWVEGDDDEIKYDIWDGTSVSEGLDGSGTIDDPYLIQSAADLNYWATNANTQNEEFYYSGKYLRLTTNIDLNEKSFPLIYKFTGTFDGNGYEIMGIKAVKNTLNDIGFFRILGGTVKNLTLSGLIWGATNVGGFAGDASSSATLINCVNNLTVKGTKTIGGFIGNGSTATINLIACINNGEILSVTTATGQISLGGMIGYDGGTVNISYSQNNGYVHHDANGSSTDIGGFVGSASGTHTFNNCVNRGDIKAGYAIGGFIGWNRGNKPMTLYNCINLGGIYGTRTSGSGWLNGIDGPFTNNTGSVTKDKVYSLTGCLHFSGEATDNQAGNAKYIPTDIALSTFTNENVASYLGHLFVLGEDGYPVLREFFDGCGSQEKPYVINTKEELIMLSQMVTVEQVWDFPSVLIALGNDIDLEDDIRFVGIGNGNKSYKGDFDGKGYTVSGLNITGNIVNGNDYAAHTGGIGFFGQISSLDTTNDVRKISNLTVEGNVQSKATTAAIVGGLVGKNSVELLIENCNFIGKVKSKTGTTVADTVGGLVATNLKKLTLENCSFDGTVYTASTDANNLAASGLVCNVGAALDINHCSVAGVIDGIGRGGSFVGALNNVNCIVNITNSYSTANVTGNYTGNTGNKTAGGLVGYLATGTIKLSNCFFDGTAPDARSTGFAGPIINYKASGTFTCENTYFNSDKNPVVEASGHAYGTGKTTAAFKDGTVVALLNANEVIFVQGENHPIFLTKPYSVADLNADGIIDTVDAIAILRHIRGIEEFAEDAILFADVNGDKEVNEADYFTTKYFVLVGIVAGEPDTVSWSILG